MDKTRILFICLGNICRSPAAHAVMRQMVDSMGVGDRFVIDSAGIGPWHAGQLPDSRMRRHGARRGYAVDHTARQFDARRDFDSFDYIVVMDDDNYANLCRQAERGKAPREWRGKIVRMADYFVKYAGRDSVPDPYYGGDADFESALDLIEDGCRGLLKSIMKG